MTAFRFCEPVDKWLRDTRRETGVPMKRLIEDAIRTQMGRKSPAPSTQ